MWTAAIISPSLVFSHIPLSIIKSTAAPMNLALFMHALMLCVHMGFYLKVKKNKLYIPNIAGLHYVSFIILVQFYKRKKERKWGRIADLKSHFGVVQLIVFCNKCLCSWLELSFSVLLIQTLKAKYFFQNMYRFTDASYVTITIFFWTCALLYQQMSNLKYDAWGQCIWFHPVTHKVEELHMLQ